jgi:FkbM family methyltransferase
LIVAIESLSGELNLLRFVLPRDFEGLIVDAGGYIGTSSIALHRMYPKAKIVSIEPSASNLKVLKKNVAPFEGISVFNGALVGKPDTDVAFYDPGEREWGFTTSASHVGASSENIIAMVTSITLQELVVAYGDIGVLKLDVEGAEAEILRLKGDVDKAWVVFVELHDRFVEGCEDAFWTFSEDRIVIKDSGEKYLSIRRG